tara:strand:+ start:171 stop:860 length:690 start_codon:yes stop_codon:yes gene_type:complete
MEVNVMSNVDGVTTSRSRVPSQGALAVTAAFLLGFSALLTAWSAYREASTSDQVIRTYAQMQETIARANDRYSQADQTSGYETSLFLQFAIEAGTGNEDAADYLLTVMDDAMYEAVLWWSDIPDEDRPATPFTDDNPYVADLFSEELLSEGDALMDEADELRLTAEEAEATSDRYNLANVFFAVVLFIAGLTTIIQRRSIQVSFLSVSILGLTSGLVLLALTPGWFSLA